MMIVTKINRTFQPWRIQLFLTPTSCRKIAQNYTMNQLKHVIFKMFTLIM